jgi:hypothetical protein
VTETLSADDRGPGVDRGSRGKPRGEENTLTALGGLAALSLDALSSVAYGPEAIVLVQVGAGIAAVRLTLPIKAAITALDIRQHRA